MAKLLFLLLVTFLSPQAVYGQAVWGGRYYNAPSCNRPNCQMCRSIRAQLAAQQQVRQQPQVSPVLNRTNPLVLSSTTSTLVARTRQVPVQTLVRRCQNGRCWYETITTYKTETYYEQQARPTPSPVQQQELQAASEAPTPHDAIPDLLPILSPETGQIVADLGCGDGRVLIAACTTFDCKGVGIEINKELATLARQSVASLNLTNKINVYNGDILKYNLQKLDVVYIYLYTDLIEQILPKLKRGTKVVSYLHEFPGSTQIGDFYVWTKP